eukprot:c49451_g1_i1.p2 GENE.c49451_g1_i1~~c49451_g1_i1.p2  ORF type:complete len:248 (-),score=67.67 c49451_g1_i1:67-810(-)
MGAEIGKMCGGDKDGDGIPDVIESAVESLSPENIIQALLECLERGIRFAVELASAAGGFLNNVAIHIPWPPQFAEAEKKLRSVGFGEKIDEFVRSLNAAAEQAARSAVDIFVSAIRALNFDRAREILDGAADAATSFLRQMCLEPLTRAFKPIVDAALEAVDVTRLWEKCVKAYNKIPFVDDINFDIEVFAVDRAIGGLFHLIRDKEAQIRANPGGEGSELIAKVFSQAAGAATGGAGASAAGASGR